MGRKGKEKAGTTSESGPEKDDRYMAEYIVPNANPDHPIRDYHIMSSEELEGNVEPGHGKDKKQNNSAGKRTSPVWNYFEEIEEPIEGSDKKVKVAYCKLLRKGEKCNYKHKMLSKHHLSNLANHLENKHPIEHESVKAAKEKRKVSFAQSSKTTIM
uniref:BED-type domain-containing protein n=1 Tax=Meloidogyne hapla TaxID=6305 RepID=A0A1I8BJW9_MELHA